MSLFVSQVWSRLALGLALLGSLFAAAPAAAQDKPVAIVALNSIDSLLADFKYLGTAAGYQEIAGFAGVMVKGYVDGVDTTRPMAVLVTTDGKDIKAYGCIPVKRLQTILDVIEVQLGQAPAKGADGLYKIEPPRGQPIYVKEANGWAYVSDKPEYLKVVTADPARVIAPIVAKYDAALHVFVKNIPQERLDGALAEIKRANQMVLGASNPNDPNTALALEINKRLMDAIETSFKEAETVTYGLNVDAAGKSVYLEFGASFKEGGRLANQIAILKDVKTDYAGLALPGAAVNYHLTSQLGPDDIAFYLALTKGIRTQMLARNDQLHPIAGEEGVAKEKEITNGLMDILDATIKSGKLDGGGVVSLDPNVVSIAFGGKWVNGAAVEKIARLILDGWKNNPNAANAKFNVAKHGGLSFHVMKVPFPPGGPPPQITQTFGDGIEVVLATGDNTSYLAIGKAPQALLKQVIDGSAAKPNQPVSPLSLQVSLVPILRFAASVEPNAPALRTLLPQIETLKNDRVMLESKVDGNALRYRITIEEGVIKLGGEAVKAFMVMQRPKPPDRLRIDDDN